MSQIAEEAPAGQPEALTENRNAGGSPKPSGKEHVRYDFPLGIRGLAALHVTVFHVLGNSPGFNSWPDWLMWVAGWVRQGYLAVDVFIVLSGFLLMIPVVRSGGVLKGGLGNFFKRRAVRIIPPYYAAYFTFLLFWPALAAFLRVFTIHFDAEVKLQQTLPYTWHNILAHLLLIHPLNSDWVRAPTGIFWTVGVEWHAYIIFALILIPLWRVAGTGASLAAAFVIALAPVYLFPGFTYTNPWRLALFALGTAGAVVAYSPAPSWKRIYERAPWGTLALVALAGLVWMVCTRPYYYTGLSPRQKWPIDTMVGIGAVCGILHLTRLHLAWKAAHPESGKPLLLRLLAWKPLAAVGHISYSLYLTHALVVIALGRTLQLFRVESVPFTLTMLLVGVPLCLILAYLFYHLFERPFLPADSVYRLPSGLGGLLRRLAGKLRRGFRLLPRPGSFRRDCLALAALTGLLFAVLFKPWAGDGFDDVFYYSYLSSPFFDGDLDVANDYALSNAPLSTIRSTLLNVGPKGLVLNQFAIGSSLLWLPFFALVRGFGLLGQGLGLSGFEWVGDRFALPYRMAVSLGSLACGFLTQVLVYATCRMMFRRGPSLVAAVAVALASPLLAYTFVHSGMSHAPSAFAVSLLVYLSLRHRKFPRPDSYVLVGAASALVVLVRWQDVILLGFPLALWLRRMLAAQGTSVSAKRELAGAGAGLAVCLVLLGLQMSYWKATLGSFVTIPQGSGFMQWTRPEILKTLFSGYHGLFYWHPLLLAGLAGLLVMAAGRTRRLIPLVCLGLFAVSTYINAAAYDWFAGASFGARRFSSVLPFLAIGIAALLSRLPRRWFPGAVAVTAGAIVLNLLLLAAYQRRLLDAFFRSDVRRMGWDVLEPLAGMLVTLPLEGTIGTLFVLKGRELKALAFLLCGWGVLALLCLLIRRPLAPGGRLARIGGAFGMILALAGSGLMLLKSPKPDALGGRLNEIEPAARAACAPRLLDLAEELVEAGHPNPGVALVTLEHRRGSPAAQKSLLALRESLPQLWARCVTDLGVYAPDAPEHQAAKPYLRKELPTWRQVCYDQIQKSRDKKKLLDEVRWTAVTLFLNPYDRVLLARMSEIRRAAKEVARAEKLLDRRLNYLRARMKSFTRFCPSLGSWGPYYFHVSGLVELAEELAEEESMRRNPKQAVKVYDLILSMTPDRSAARLRRAMAALDAGMEVEDAEWISQLGRSSDLPSDTLIALATFHRRRGDYLVTAQVLRDGLKRFPNDPRFPYHLNTLFADSNLTTSVLEQLAAVEDGEARYWSAVGGAQLRFQRPAEAERALRRALDAGAQDGYTCFLLGQALWNQKRLEEALPHYRKAFEKQPEFVPTGRFLAETLHALGRRDEAIQVLKEALARHPSDGGLLALRKAWRADGP